MGVSEGAVSHWFKGDNAPDIDNLYEICQYIGVSLDQVFGIDQIYVNTLSEDENNLIMAYRKAGSETKSNIRSILKITETKKDTDVSAI